MVMLPLYSPLPVGLSFPIHRLGKLREKETDREENSEIRERIPFTAGMIRLGFKSGSPPLRAGSKA